MQSVIYETLLGQISAILNITEVKTDIKTRMCLPPIYLQHAHFLNIISKLRCQKLKINLDTGSCMVDLKEIQKHSSFCVSSEQVSSLGRAVRDKKTRRSLRPIMLISSGFCVLGTYS